MTLEETRKNFESWFEAEAYPLEHSNWFQQTPEGDYVLPSVDNLWGAWKAAYESMNTELSLLKEHQENAAWLQEAGYTRIIDNERYLPKQIYFKDTDLRTAVSRARETHKKNKPVPA